TVVDHLVPIETNDAYKDKTQHDGYCVPDAKLINDTPFSCEDAQLRCNGGKDQDRGDQKSHRHIELSSLLSPVAALAVSARREPHRAQSGEDHHFLGQEHDGAYADHIGSVQRSNTWCCHTLV